MATNMSAIIPILRQGHREGEGASTRPRRRRTSGVWEFFVLRPAAGSTGAQDRALCRTCLKELTAGSTSHLRRHKCYQEWLIIKAPPAVVPLPAAPAAAPPPPPPASPVITVAEEDVFSGLDDILTI